MIVHTIDVVSYLKYDEEKQKKDAPSMSPNPQWAFVRQCSISMWSPCFQRAKVKAALAVAEAEERERFAHCTNALRANLRSDID